MVEGDRRPNPLIDQVAKQRRAKQASGRSEAQAKEMLPDFKEQLGGLIIAKIPPPEVIKVTRLSLDIERDDDPYRGKSPRKLKTRLTAIVPLEDGGSTLVTVSSSRYPGAVYSENGKPVSAEALDYQVDVEELDNILIIEGSAAIVQSKIWKHEPFTRHTPIGVALPTWPAWERKATAEDIQQYQTLLEGLNQEGVTFEGTTPLITIKDYSEWRARTNFLKTQE